MSDLKYRLVIIGGVTLMDRFMHDADLFENFKRLVDEPAFYDVTIKPDTTIAQRIEVVREQFTKQEAFFCVAILALGTPHRWIDPAVKVVSFGKKWCLLRDFIEHLGAEYAPEVGFSSK